jgi:hypothetical protein
MEKYRPLRTFLENSERATETLTIEQLERILNFELPPSAFTYRQWWGNNAAHTQANAWLDAGWEVDTVRLGFDVTFRRINNGV